MSRVNAMTKAGRRVAAVLAGILLCTCFFSCGYKLTYTIEAGSELPDPFVLLGKEGGAYVEGYDPTVVNRPGTHTLSVTDENGKVYTLTLNVKDRTKPVFTTRHVYYPLGMETPRAEDFINTIKEVDTYEAYFTEELPPLDHIGDYDVAIRVKDASGNESDEMRSILTVIEDTAAPTFDVVPELSAYVGEAIAYRKGLVVTDNCLGEITVTVDASGVNTAKPGHYPVYYTATDMMGNMSTAETVIHIYERQVTEDQVYAAVDAILARITVSGMTKAEKLQAVHAYILPTEEGVSRPITLVGDSDKSDWVRAAYDSLLGSRQGDCFNFMAVAKAFCQRIGVENHVIQRTEGAAAGTHYWLLVNVGTTEKPEWYHYDCTPLQIPVANGGCLMTDAQLREYNAKRPGFYAYDSTAYPSVSTQVYVLH